MRHWTALVLLLAVVTSACQIRTDIEIIIEADESGSIAFELGFDEEFRRVAASEGGELSFDGFDGLSDVPDEWSVSDFDDGEFAGTRVAVEFSSLADLQTKLAELDSGSDDPTADFFESVDVTRDGDTFRFEATLSQLEETLTDAGDFDFGIDPAQLLAEVFLIRFVVTMPGEVTSHNADTLDGSTLVWEVPLDGRNRTLEAVSGSSNGLPTMLLIVAAGGLGFLAFLWFTVSRRRKAENTLLYGDNEGHVLRDDDSSQPVGADPFAR